MHRRSYFCSKQLRPPSREFQFCRHRSRSAGGTITIPILPLQIEVLLSVALQEAVRLFCLSLYIYRMLSLCQKIVNFILWTVSLFASLAPSQFINVSSGLLVLTFNHLKLNLLSGNKKLNLKCNIRHVDQDKRSSCENAPHKFIKTTGALVVVAV